MAVMAAPDEPDQAADEGVGGTLRRAREARGLSIAEVAASLHLDKGMVEALELGDEDRLPAPIFVRGYLRGYARLLEIDEGPLLERYQPAEPASPRLPQPVRSGVSIDLPRIPWGKLLRLLVLLGVLALGLWLGPRLWERWQSPDEDSASPEQGELALPLAPPSPAEGDASSAAPGEGTPLGLPEPESPVPAVPVPAAPEPAAPAAAATGGEAQQPAGLSIRVELQGDSWVEMRDARGRRLLYGLYKQGTVKEVQGVPPVSVKLGNSRAVRIQVDGQPFDHSRYNRGNLARFEIGAQGPSE